MANHLPKKTIHPPKKTVEEWLNTVSYKPDPDYVPSEFALEFISFIKSVNASMGGEENTTPIMHYKMLDALAGKKKNIANLCHRGAAKTSVMAEYLFLYIAVTGGIPGFGKINFALYVSDSIENGVKNMRKNLEHRWENSDFLQYYLPKKGMRLTDVRYQFTNLDGHKFVVRGYGAQALSLDSILYTKDGLTTMKEIKVGDSIYDPTGNLVRVKAKSEIFHKPMYRINLSDGRTIKVSEDHLNSVRFNQRINKILTTKELLKSKLVRIKPNGNKSYNYHIVNTEPLNYSKKEFLLDPYTLGLLLGDGSIKRIPEDYFYGSISQRIELVRGLIDTDGSISPEGKVTFTSTSKALCDGLLRLVRSLGGTGKFFKGRLAKGNHRKLYKIGIWLNMNTAKLPRKANREKFNKSLSVAITSIEPIDLEPSQCIAVESELKEYLTDDYTRTHNTGVRGAKEMGQRPTLAIMDDLISDEDARSPTVIAAIEDTVHKAVNFALHSSRSKRVWSGTPFNAKDPLYKVVESGAWWVNVYPVCEKFPCEREEFRGSWEDRFDYDYVKEQYDTALALGQIHSFNQELMLRIMSDEDRLITDDDIQWYDVKRLMKAKSNFNFYITTDFATSEETSADYSVIAVWALNNNRDWFLVDAVVKRQLMDKNIDYLFRMVSRYKPLEVGIEISGQQKGFIAWVKKEMLTRNIFFNLAKTGTKEGIQPTTNKMTRFSVVVPWFKAKKMYFPREAKNSKAIIEFIEELSLATVRGFKSKHDDCIDTISMLALLNAWEPSYDSPSVNYTERADNLSPPQPWGLYDTDIDFLDYEEESGLSGYLG